MTISESKESAAPQWTIQKLLQWTTSHFSGKGIASSRLDSELLLSHTLNCKRLDLYLRFDQPVGLNELKSFKELVVRRSKREPIAYILGRQEFYGRNFSIPNSVLIPRPETEHLVDEALKFLKASPKENLSLLDIGCGSGAIALSVISEKSNVSAVALDISKDACAVTQSNAKSFEVEGRIEIVESEFLEFQNRETRKFDIVLSNPPYISLEAKDKLEADVLNYEPPVALFGGAKGFELLAHWIPAASKLLEPNSLFLCEIGYDQGEIVIDVAEKTNAFRDIEILKDYSGHSRILRAYKRADG